MRALETDISLNGGSGGQTGVGLSLGDFENLLKESLEVERLALWDLCEGILDGSLLRTLKDR